MNQENTLDIISSGEFPADVLSNFHENTFVFDGVKCASMEGLLQSLKTKNKVLQIKICLLSQKNAKKVFRRKPQNAIWKLTGILWWQGKPMRRGSDEYQRFLDRAYDALYTNEKFVRALIAAEGKTLTHSVGKSNSRKTILTEYEFLTRLERCRERALREQPSAANRR